MIMVLVYCMINIQDSIEWHEIKFPQNTSLPLPRYQHSAVISGKNMIIFGGKYKHQKLNDVWCLDTESYKWTKVETIGTTPSPRYGHVACCVGKYMIIWGGFSLNIEVNLNGYTNEVYLLDTGEDYFQKLIKLRALGLVASRYYKYS